MTLTNTNVYVLAAAIKDGNGVVRAVSAGDMSHLKRCLTMGMLVKGTEAGTWELTDVGNTTVNTYNERMGYK